jgi:general L-amino acid transport system substrate-binding protein
MQPGTRRLAVFTLSTAMLFFEAEVMAAEGSGSATLDAVKAHGQMLCGVYGQVPGFSLPDSQGVMRGLDADTCRAITAAVLGNVSKVKIIATSTQNRFTALQSGEIDVLAHSTTWTLAREANLGLAFAWVNYYDGTGFLVKKSAGVKWRKKWMERQSAWSRAPAPNSRSMTTSG